VQSLFINQFNDHASFFLELCLIQTDPKKYHFVSQGMTTIDGVDDAEEMRITDEAFDTLGFTQVWID
jgi:myosin heavy subunit